ncbi:Hypothetical protein CINCED_3A016877 [Cinara cedri]|uniref:Coiled-coil domain-containing protein 181 n=1 Tax=Cinara cedri TaxID=506608 RepID=A0A5E4M2R1_9HEMI|nr:Hypothetical protein CINCED_3A016877 [Cinara cedri]
MSPAEKKTTETVRNENTDNLPFDIYDEQYANGSREFPCGGGVKNGVGRSVLNNVTSNSPDTILNREYDEDDEEDFIKIYFASGTVLQPSGEPYNLRSKIDQANRDLQTDDAEPAKFSNVPGKVKFDNTVVVLDSFEDIGTVPIGTETLHGCGSAADLGRKDRGNNDDGGDGDILAAVDLSRNDEDDQNDVVCSTAEKTTSQDGTADCTVTDDRVYSASTCTASSFSRSFSSDSADGCSGDRPLFINVIESGDEFKAIMDRNNRARQHHQGSAIDEQVTYFPELFTHTQYKMYENSGKTAVDDASGDDDDLNIYVPKRLDAEELRNKLKEICCKQRKRVVQQRRPANDIKNNKVDKSVTKKFNNNNFIGGSLQNGNNNTRAKKDNQSLTKKTSSAVKKIAQPCNNEPGPRTTYYFELDPKGKLKPLNENNVIDETGNNGKSANNKFFRINLKAAKNNSKTSARNMTVTNCSKTPNTDLFLEFQTDKCGRKGAKLIIKKKPPQTAEECGVTNSRSNNNNKRVVNDVERPRLPGYNGLRSEYGLSAEQLLERRRIKTERETRRREFRQKKHEEEQKKRAENEKNFYKWLQQKKQMKKLQVKTSVRHSYPINRLTVSSARTSVNPTNTGNQLRKGSFALEELLKIKDDNIAGWFKF